MKLASLSFALRLCSSLALLMLSLFLLTSLSGCKHAETSKSDRKAQLPMTTTDSALSDVPDLKGHSLDDAIETLDLGSAESSFSCADGSITVQRPAGKDWACRDDQMHQAGMTVTVVNCRSLDADRIFYMMASDYTVPPDRVMEPKATFHEFYMKSYEAMFSSVEILEEGEENLFEQKGYQVELRVQDAEKGEIRKREWLAAVGDHVVLLSAEGSPAAFDELEKEMTSWFSNSRFEILRP